MESGARFIGQPVPRVEDRPLLTGRGSFVDDLQRPGQLWARVVRSEVAHGRIEAIETAAARARAGVIDVVTGADLPPELRIPLRLDPTPAVTRTLQPPLAAGEVHYVGEPVAVVVADDPYTAEDAAEELRITVEPLAAAVEAPEAAADGAPALQKLVPDNVLDVIRAGHGDVDAAFAAADLVVRRTLAVQRHTAVPLETRGLVAEPGRDGLTVWGPAKVKHHNRLVLAELLGLDSDQVRFIEPDVGGGFGPRGEFYPEDFLIPWLALRLKRPVKWIEDRREHLLACNHSRQQTCELAVAAAADGRLLGFRARVLIDMGAYARTHGMLLAKNTASHLPGAYRWQAFEVEAIGVVTPKTPVGTYRGPGQVEPAFHRERVLDLVAARLGVDPAEIRRRNLIPASSLPCQISLGETERPIIFESGDFPRVLEALLEHVGYEALSAEVQRRRKAGELVGLGLSTYSEISGRGPYEWARVVPATDGSFEVLVGIASVGQGIRTVLAQIAAEGLGVPLQRVRVRHHDTDAVPEGGGAFSSRSVLFGGNAVAGAVADLHATGAAKAAGALGVPVSEIEIVAGAIARDRDRPERSVSIAELGCEGNFRFEKQGRTYSMGAALVLAGVDPDTGGVSVERCVVACDVGRAINPMIVDGQIAGAAAQGIGGALLEELAYLADGQPISTSFMDYCMPTAAEVPRVESVVLELAREHANRSNPLGVKGAGEVGIVGIPAAVANAVAAALGAVDGVLELPVRPDRVIAAMTAARAANGR
jgi:carbon-monoxide dehydrogenase large subunit